MQNVGKIWCHEFNLLVRVCWVFVLPVLGWCFLCSRLFPCVTRCLFWIYRRLVKGVWLHPAIPFAFIPKRWKPSAAFAGHAKRNAFGCSLSNQCALKWWNTVPKSTEPFLLTWVLYKAPNCDSVPSPFAQDPECANVIFLPFGWHCLSQNSTSLLIS